MATSIQQSMLTGLQVRLAMRRNPLRLDQSQSLDRAISCMIKYKVSAVLIADLRKELDLGLSTKTDLIALYYAGLPLETALGQVLIAPILTCTEQEPLETALSLMLEQRVKRIYVCEDRRDSISGVLSYADIAGLLYGFCSRCNKSRANSKHSNGLDQTLLVSDVMQQNAVSCRPEHSIGQALETLSLQTFSALLVQGGQQDIPGVLSKTDLILAYRHKLPLEARVQDITNFPALSCSREEPLVQALQRMILADVHRLFVHGKNNKDIQGVISLTDAARARSGSCRACKASRLQ